MKNLLLAISIGSVLAFAFLRACGSNSAKKDGVKDSLTNENSKVVIDNPIDTNKSTKSGIQNTDPTLANQQNNGDTNKRIHYHQSPNQHELDSIKSAKTQLKKNN